ncbi:helix-turn-helix domain-containing protein [Halalkalibacter alkalisediminis]|uniref:Helix-turn-helix domain-containing protein n=1 Tax=Halalkalibacter alkalisediminis TaxID=935616 RepID=A0ABV6N9Z9_9BACI|nr:helix-turn-helix transcriptional regulator [Halalkalibacter alkalisediminis]
MTQTLMYIGNQVRRLRKEKKWTLLELAEKSGLTLNYLAQIERGEVNVSIGKLEAILQALETDWSYIFPHIKLENQLQQEILLKVMEMKEEASFRLVLALIRELEDVVETEDYALKSH